MPGLWAWIAWNALTPSVPVVWNELPSASSALFSSSALARLDCRMLPTVPNAAAKAAMSLGGVRRGVGIGHVLVGESGLPDGGFLHRTLLALRIPPRRHGPRP